MKRVDVYKNIFFNSINEPEKIDNQEIINIVYDLEVLKDIDFNKFIKILSNNSEKEKLFVSFLENEIKSYIIAGIIKAISENKDWKLLTQLIARFRNIFLNVDVNINCSLDINNISIQLVKQIILKKYKRVDKNIKIFIINLSTNNSSKKIILPIDSNQLNKEISSSVNKLTELNDLLNITSILT